MVVLVPFDPVEFVMVAESLAAADSSEADLRTSEKVGKGSHESIHKRLRSDRPQLPLASPRVLSYERRQGQALNL